ncbi:alpha/beta fold hydrolase [Agrococcus jenensis]|uniref:Pimeloyl-ACP methyl ester carboxylesterase n=1 Tax=Agrococcus jenensis TaxID=46353 RepID=A0A3N2APA7_9MICO|nr:alpha/beta hydrolase [Agrococcus jenensis]ROR64880.1 pimeloyl-ACP methyl ester carboxylesterase [Agrococcus jenensis]
MTEPLVVLLHGWPGLPSDYDRVIPLLPGVRCVAPPLLGFGERFEGPMAPGSAAADAHARRLLATLPGDAPLLVAGYDIGSRIAQAMLRMDPARFVGAVLTPGYPGIGTRAAAGDLAPRFWYQHFHRTPVAASLIDGRADAVREHLAFLTGSWAASGELTTGPRFDDVVAAYARPGAFAASIAWYRDNVGYAGGRPTSVPTTMLWPERDPLFPLAWADEVGAWFTRSRLQTVPGGHFVPLESPEAMAAAIATRLGR